ncbi:MAG: tetratricopeptide repeat protein [Candidatus Berkelbacteria bacterium]|nr:tetratricopeptide repeat protein [Candidatus Berkelbacteria bacterium]MCR4307929.1 tetratricopeptide repeat protein [Candidatus Berkelbacteria bacterium]
MPSIDFEDLLAQADRLRNSAQVDEAIKAYKEIVSLASDNHENFFRARAFHLAGVAAKESVLSIESSYYRDALNYFASAEEIYRTLGDRKMLGGLYRDIASCADYAQDSQTAVNYFQKAIETLEPTEFFGELAVTYDKLGLHFYKQNLPKQAEPFIEKALNLFKNDPSAGFFRSTTLLDGARIQFKLGNFEKARDWAEESLGWYLAEHPGSDYGRRLAQLHGLLSAIYGELGDQKKANEAYGKYQVLLQIFDPLAAKVIEKDLRELAS